MSDNPDTIEDVLQGFRHASEAVMSDYPQNLRDRADLALEAAAKLQRMQDEAVLARENQIREYIANRRRQLVAAGLNHQKYGKQELDLLVEALRTNKEPK